MAKSEFGVKGGLVCFQSIVKFPTFIFKLFGQENVIHES